MTLTTSFYPYQMIVYYPGRGWRRVELMFPDEAGAIETAAQVKRSFPGLVTEVWPKDTLDVGIPLAGHYHEGK